MPDQVKYDKGKGDNQPGNHHDLVAIAMFRIMVFHNGMCVGQSPQFYCQPCSQSNIISFDPGVLLQRVGYTCF
jgi:hypothetical protein